MCTGENEEWTIYQGGHICFDGREGAIGNTNVRENVQDSLPLTSATFEVRPRYVDKEDSDEESDSEKEKITVAAKTLQSCLSKSLDSCIVSLHEVIAFRDGDQEYVARLTEVKPEENEEEHDDDDEDDEDDETGTKPAGASDPSIFTLSDHYRGQFGPWTR